MNNDNLKISLASFIAWRKASGTRAEVKTRARMLAWCGKSWTISEDHKRAYFHEVRDFAAPVFDSKDNKGVRDTRGYYADNFANDCVRWSVVKIAPVNKKHNREALYAPVTYRDECEGVTLYLDSIGSQDDAIRWGDGCAQAEAEEAREDDAKYQAEQQISQQKNEAYNLLLDTKRIIAGARASTLHPDICANIREYIKDNHEALRECLRKIKDLRADYWLAVNPY